MTTCLVEIARSLMVVTASSKLDAIKILAAMIIERIGVMTELRRKSKVIKTVKNLVDRLTLRSSELAYGQPLILKVRHRR